jgi:hypothetical protein
VATHEERNLGQHGSGALVHEGDWLSERPRLVLLAALAAFAIAGVIAAVDGGGSGTSASTTAAPANASSQIAPVGVSAAGLKALVSGTLKQTVYWVGPKRGDVYELQRSANGSVYIRYLPPGVKAGDPRAAFLIVATYPFSNALQRLQGGANGAGTPLRGGGFALVDAAHPTSVHVAFPGINYEVEVYDPSPSVARRVAESAVLRPVG